MNEHIETYRKCMEIFRKPVAERCSYDEWRSGVLPFYHPEYTEVHITGETFDLESHFEMIKSFYGM